MNRDVDLGAVLDVDPDQLDPAVRDQLTGYVAAREQALVDLRVRALDAEQEAAALERELDSTREELATLRERVGDDVAPVDTEHVLAAFGEALESDRLADAGFTVSDISVDLRTDVVQTEDGVRLRLPTTADDRRSDLQFTVRSAPPAAGPDYDEVPDLHGLDRPTAEAALADAGFTVGRVETTPSETDPGLVVDQLPSPFSLADPGAPVDLVFGEAPGSTDAPESADVTAIDGIGEKYGARLREAGIASLTDLVVADAESVAEVADVSETRAADWIAAAPERLDALRRSTRRSGDDER
jgi:hypothetical protein